MPIFSAFTPFGAGFEFSGAPSHGETIYRSMISNIGASTESLSTEEGSRMRGFCYASAMTAARVRYTLEHAGYQLDPLKVTEMLPLREEEYGLVPAPTDSIDDRRAALAARLLAPRGGALNTIRTALNTLLGDDFIQYIPTAFSDAVVSPPSCGDQPQNLVTINRLPKVVTILDAIDTVGVSRWVRYQFVDVPNSPIQESPTLPPATFLVGETIVVDAGHNVRNERVTITGLRELTPGVLEFQALFNVPHNPGVIATNMPYPYWLSSKRSNLVVVPTDTALDPEVRRKINELLARMVRAVSTWAIVQEDPLNPGHTGVFQAGISRTRVQTLWDVPIPL